MRHIPGSQWVLLAALLAGNIAASPIPKTQTLTTKPHAIVEAPIAPTAVKRRDDGVYFVDFGRAWFAQLELRIAPPSGDDVGRNVLVRLGEKLADPEHVDRKPGASVRFLETSITIEKGKSAYRVEMPKRDQRLIPSQIGAVMPFRYVELENMPPATSAQNLTADGIRQIAVHYPFNDSAADFVCSNEKLNAIWSICKHTIKATSFAGVFVDGDRERKPYEADAYINQLGWYYCTDDWTLPRYTHEYLITHPTWPTEWIMFSVLIAWNDYLYTGDPASLKAYYDDLKAKTLRRLQRGDGLISTVEPPVPASILESIHLREKMKDVVDWPIVERDGYEMRPVNTVVNAFHCRSLAVMADIAGALGKADDAADFRQAAQRSQLALNAKLVDSSTSLYVDGEGSKHSSLHGNMFPLAFGLVPADRREKVLEFVQSRQMACSVYGAQFLVDALFENGRGAHAVNLMLAPGDRSWRHMVEDVGTTMTLEAWDTKYKPNQDWNHAWGAAPANLIPAKILGVEPLEPGYRKVRIWPRCASPSDLPTVSWARGKVPTVKGPILVDWRHNPTGFALSLELPAGVIADVRLPSNWGRAVQVDGHATTGEDRDGAVVVEVTQAGIHQLRVGE